MILAMYLAAFCLIMTDKTGSMWFGLAACMLFLIADIRYSVLKDRIKKLEEKEKKR